MLTVARTSLFASLDSPSAITKRGHLYFGQKGTFLLWANTLVIFCVKELILGLILAGIGAIPLIIFIVCLYKKCSANHAAAKNEKLSLDQARIEQEINKQMVAKTAAQISKLKSDEQDLMQTNHQLTEKMAVVNKENKEIKKQMATVNKESREIKQQMETMTDQFEQLKQLAASTLNTTTTQSNKPDGEY